MQDCARKAGTTLEVVPPVNTLEAKDSTPIAHRMARGGAHMLVNAGRMSLYSSSTDGAEHAIGLGLGM